ncbi:BREX-1 system adenine-specific DNA-methyltransferase PglX [Citrobacter braakii]|uniref:BREX-1 system adenine-specific DNA-methyltransferase PglX n=1 Tax=Citrobacter braakii TaxID=57706 RepID=UPI0039769E3B
MNTSNIKKYAPVARKQFRDAVMQKLTTLGIEADKKGNLQIAQATDLGDSVRYGQFSLDKALASRRERLVKRAEKQGYDVLVEHIAYTWFNRFCAIRYMELHGYLDHGFRMLSHPTLEGGFEVLDHVTEVADALGLDKSRLVEMKLAGDRDEELYRELLLAQCHALHGAMPFLFEAVNDEIELVLPDNLTRTDSILRGLVDEKAIPKEDWDQIEVIGWLYQFYISEKKDDVIGKVVKSEDIPAATQLFTPNWIVQYLVQNSVGRQWLQTYPDSSLKGKMPYYIEPAEQTPEVRAQLAAITASSIEPESIKVLDPACGSGHILTEAYNVLKAIYEERGYRTRDIPQLILENNIFGLDIDDRAAQLSGFAMLMLARQDDRRILGRGIRLNIVSLQESKLDIAELWTKLNFHQQVQRGSVGDMFAEGAALTNTDSAEYKLLMRMLALFTSAKTLGSLIQVSHEDEEALKAFLDGLYRLAVEGDIQQKEAAAELIPYIQQAWILAQRYDAVVANPPYMGGKFQAPDVKKYLKDNFSGYEKDLFSAFIVRNLELSKNGAQLGFMTPFVWMFISSYEELRSHLINQEIITSLIQLEYSGFDGATVPICTFTLQKGHIDDFTGSYVRLSDFRGAANQGPKTLEAIQNHNCGWFFEAKSDNFNKIPFKQICFDLPKSALACFSLKDKLSSVSSAKAGLTTGDNNLFQRYWYEVDLSKFSLKNQNNKKWFPCNSGGEYRKWYGNNLVVVDWESDGYSIKNFFDSNGRRKSSPRSTDRYFQEGVTWSKIGSGKFSARYFPEGFIFDDTGQSVFPEKIDVFSLLGLLCSNIGSYFLGKISQTLSFNKGEIESIPYVTPLVDISKKSREAIELSKADWDSKEISWDFDGSEVIECKNSILKNAFQEMLRMQESKTEELRKIEEDINSILIESYGLSEVLTPYVMKENVSLFNNPSYLYGGGDDLEIVSLRFLSEQLIGLISYIIGCQMGRYSLDREGLVYAHEGNKGFAELVAEGAYKTFPADEDGILPLMDSDWFDDDVTARVKEFVRTVWGEEHLQENLDFIAESLCSYAIKPKKGESSLDTIRRYLSTQFWKDHMKMYKKRPIYWLFSSGKEKAFECLVYLHRYNEGTLSRMRTEYVVPLLARYQGNIDLVNDQLKNAESGAATTRLKKELDGLTKKFNELRNFDDRLRHYADRRITIDLDDGVKVNYGKFGDLLADVKAITGSAPQEE